MKTSELTGHALDWAVAKCEGLLAYGYKDDAGLLLVTLSTGETEYFKPTLDWAQAGPIIEREEIAVRFEPECHWLFAPPEATWLANYNGVGEWHGPTPLIAAMRCFVASKLGDTVDIPEELTNV
jgi:hypothetical protein